MHKICKEFDIFLFETEYLGFYMVPKVFMHKILKFCDICHGCEKQYVK